ncbi:SRPBCC family protein (plasmid) [Limimaricola variabilis]
MKLDPSTDLTFTRIIDAPRALLWECWTTPEHVKNFFVPKPHEVSDCQIDLRPGGRFNTTFKVDGKEMRNDGVCLEVIDGRRLVFTDAYAEGWKPAADPFMTAIIEFEDHPEGGTTYTATARHRSADARQQHEDMGFYDGWGTVATQLEEYAKTLGAKADATP